MKAMIVVPGRPSSRLRTQIRYMAQCLAESGRVLVVFTKATRNEVPVLGRAGPSSLLGNAPSGHPLWTGRLSAAFGLRRRQNTVLVVLFDGATIWVALGAGVVARLRREHVVVHDGRSSGVSQAGRCMAGRALFGLAHRVYDAPLSEDTPRTHHAIAVCGTDDRLVDLILATIDGMADTAAEGWCFELFVDPSLLLLDVGQLRRPRSVTLRSGAPDRSTLLASDVVIVDRTNGHLADFANQCSASGVIVDRQLEQCIMKRVDGVWVARAEVSSLLVTLEAATHEFSDGHMSAPRSRAVSDGIVDVVLAGACER